MSLAQTYVRPIAIAEWEDFERTLLAFTWCKIYSEYVGRDLRLDGDWKSTNGWRPWI